MSLRALVTNDDGVDSPGIVHLAQAAVAAGLDVTLVAPKSEHSGTSAALTAVQAEGRIVVEERSLHGLDGVPAYAVAGAPGFIVLIAQRGAFGAAPDIVLSGINRGANTGNAIIHSGTVGATLTAGTYGMRGLAVSIASATPVHWGSAAEVARRVLPALIDAREALVLNLNVPDVELADVRGVRRAPLARFGAVQTTLAEVGKGYVRLGVSEKQPELDPDSDAALLAAGYATLTPLDPICERLDAQLPELDGLLEQLARR